jgi:hypothetical protein
MSGWYEPSQINVSKTRDKYLGDSPMALRYIRCLSSLAGCCGDGENAAEEKTERIFLVLFGEEPQT